MSQLSRKSQAGGFEAGEEQFKAAESGTAPGPDFSALEAESGFSTGTPEDRIRRAKQAPAAMTDERVEIGSERAESRLPKAAQPTVETPAKKRYYSPGEVMKKKGCIGCGGMALAMPIILAALVLAIASL